MSKVVGQIKYTVEDEVTQQIVDDICCAAFEGGINYWCTEMIKVDEFPEGATHASDVISRGGSIEIFDGEEERWHKLTLSSFLKGLKEELMDRRITLQDFYDNHDASDADNVIQRALFGEVIYG